MAMSEGRQSWPWTVAVTLGMALFGAFWLWSAWSLIPPSRERLSVFHALPSDFWIDETRPRRGAMRVFSGLRLDVGTPDGVLRLRVPANISIFLDDEPKSARITVLVNPRSETMLDISSASRTYLGYEEGAAHARQQAQKEGLLGLVLIGAGGFLYWENRRKRRSLSR
jgi:hypothetical protein